MVAGSRCVRSVQQDVAALRRESPRLCHLGPRESARGASQLGRVVVGGAGAGCGVAGVAVRRESLWPWGAAEEFGGRGARRATQNMVWSCCVAGLAGAVGQLGAPFQCSVGSLRRRLMAGRLVPARIVPPISPVLPIDGRATPSPGVVALSHSRGVERAMCLQTNHLPVRFSNIHQSSSPTTLPPPSQPVSRPSDMFSTVFDSLRVFYGGRSPAIMYIRYITYDDTTPPRSQPASRHPDLSGSNRMLRKPFGLNGMLFNPFGSNRMLFNQFGSNMMQFNQFVLNRMLFNQFGSNTMLFN